MADGPPGRAASGAGPGGTAARHLVLLGLPGAGKSTVGPLVAAALGRRFVDLDTLVEERAGAPVARIFAERGEPAFRALERALTAEVLAADAEPVVLAPGGGWVEDAANRAHLGEVADAVYLRVSPEAALARIGEVVETRPLLAGGDSAAKMRELLARRERFYVQARYAVSNEMMSPAEASALIVALATGVRRD